MFCSQLRSQFIQSRSFRGPQGHVVDIERAVDVGQTPGLSCVVARACPTCTRLRNSVASADARICSPLEILSLGRTVASAVVVLQFVAQPHILNECEDERTSAPHIANDSAHRLRIRDGFRKSI